MELYTVVYAHWHNRAKKMRLKAISQDEANQIKSHLESCGYWVKGIYKEK